MASFPVGSTFVSGTIAIHRYRPSISITDLVNAGKRGKKVSILNVGVSGDTQSVLDEIASRLVACDNYSEALSAVNRMKEENAYIWISTSTARGIDVEVPGKQLSISGVNTSVIASPTDFRVKSWYYFEYGPKRDVEARQDTNYWPVSKKDAGVFYTWFRENIARTAKMDIHELEKVWHQLGVKYDSH
jgi:hypothetical protein